MTTNIYNLLVEINFCYLQNREEKRALNIEVSQIRVHNEILVLVQRIGGTEIWKMYKSTKCTLWRAAAL